MRNSAALEQGPGEQHKRQRLRHDRRPCKATRERLRKQVDKFKIQVIESPDLLVPIPRMNVPKMETHLMKFLDEYRPDLADHFRADLAAQARMTTTSSALSTHTIEGFNASDGSWSI